MANDDGFIEVQENSTPEEEAAAAQEAVESLPKATGKGMFFKPSKASRPPKQVEPAEDEGDSDEGDEPLEAAPAPKPERAAKKAEPAAAEPAAEELIPDDLARQIEAALLADPPMDPARSASLKRQESRAVREAQEQAQRAQQTLDAVLASLRPGSPGKAQPEPEEEIDIFSDPDKFLERKNKPVMSKVEQMEQQLVQLQQQIQAQQIRSAEAQFAASNPGYTERVQVFNRAAYEDALQLFGGDERAATEMMNSHWAGMLTLAQRAGRDPFPFIHEMTARYLRGRGIQPPGEAAPARQPEAQPAAKPNGRIRRDGSIAAAQAAMQSAAGRSLSTGGAEDASAEGSLSAAALVEMGPKAAQEAVRRLVAQKGINSPEWRRMMEGLEDRAAAERGR